MGHGRIIAGMANGPWRFLHPTLSKGPKDGAPEYFGWAKEGVVLRTMPIQ
jgi:hypothetical protein